ncbi:peptidyl-prolyl cis-trans isomerase [Arenibacter sp. 6A1]|uniref:peptidyl-prolyl cis-trans isomerase n=1 Tax=Arenibacter sp. 6A1 TaxID=2720391 RepID=UPI001445D7F5|nr:peptidyl-prolyl cis-trans isomerase [Arenibacter sp. 6A1]NKI27785.1 peptidyl-prolyl cis-trans isomerase [Arenibacter sp. 6A1]
MYFLRKNLSITSKWLLLALLGVVLGSCGSFFKNNEDKTPIARVGEAYLYKEDIESLFENNKSKADSATYVTNYINTWASKQLLLSKAKINLPEKKLKIFEQLVSNYRTDLYTGAYKEALVLQSQDTSVSREQLNDFYERQKENFKLKEKLVKLRFVALPVNYLDKDLVSNKLKRFKEEDKKYLDSISIQFKKYNLNDSIWVSAIRVMEEIPLIVPDNQGLYLKNSQFFELQDSLGVYLAKINEVLEINQIAPLSYVEPTIKQLLLSRRKLEFMKKLEAEIIDEAIKEKEFEVYE